MNERKILTADQQQLVNEFVIAYGLDETQISFEGSDLNPILDYEALSVMRVKLTNFRDVKVGEPIHNVAENSVSVSCVITLADGRSIDVSEKVYAGDLMPDGSTIETRRQMETFARARAMRFAIRSAGVNLVRAHREFLKTGEVATGNLVDPRYPQYQEINAIAYKLGLKKKRDDKTEDREEYEKVLAENFDGRTSAKELDDVELKRFALLLRTLQRLQNAKEQAAA